MLTRLPPPARQTPAAATRLLAGNFPETRFLSVGRASTLLTELAGRGVAGGAVHDALVAEVAVEHSLVLATRDRRAQDVYRALGVRTWVLG